MTAYREVEVTIVTSVLDGVISFIAGEGAIDTHRMG
jgi:hypothetical protein